jgi:hypothetical protein
VEQDVERAAQGARQIRETLEQAVGLARQLSTSMTALAAEPLLQAASRREEVHRALSASIAELGEILAEVARQRGWQEVTLERLASVAPRATVRLSQELEQVRRGAALLKDMDGRNRVQGLRALGWLRSALGSPEGGSSAYDRRGQVVGAGTLSTSNRTL